MINRFSVPLLSESTIHLANVASANKEPDKVLFNARILSTYSDRILENKEIWISKGRIACIKDNGNAKTLFSELHTYDIQNHVYLYIYIY